MFGSIPKFLKTANTEFHLRIGATARLPPRIARTTHGNFRSPFRCLACYFSIVVGSCVAQNYKDRMTGYRTNRRPRKDVCGRTSIQQQKLKWSKKVLRLQQRLRLIENDSSHRCRPPDWSIREKYLFRTIHAAAEGRTHSSSLAWKKKKKQQMPMSSHLGRPTSAKIPRAWTCHPPLRQKKRTC